MGETELELGGFSIGKPAGLLAEAQPELWRKRRSELIGDQLILLLGSRTKDERAERGDAMILLTGPAPDAEPEATRDERFVPEMALIVGPGANPKTVGEPKSSFNYPFWNRTDLTLLQFKVASKTATESDKRELDRALAEMSTAPKWMRVSYYESGVWSLEVDDRVVGYILGRGPVFEFDFLNDGIRNMVASFYGYR